MAEGEGFARRVTLENLDQFSPLLRQPRSDGGGENGEEEGEEGDLGQANRGDPSDEEAAAAEDLFQGEYLTVDLQYRRPSRAEGEIRETARQPAFEGTGSAVTASQTRGDLRWQKTNLQKSDAQRPSPGSNPTGVVRLAKAGNPIDQRTFFRDELFANRAWTEVQEDPKKEEASVRFRVTLLGNDYGERNLTVSHQASRIAGQNNVPTVLHWGNLGDTVRDLNILGRTLRIYDPPSGQEEPFFLEVV